MSSLLAAPQAPATGNAASFQVGPAGEGLTAAIAATNPHGMPIFHMRKPNRDKLAETLPRDVRRLAADTAPVVVRLLNGRPSAIAQLVVAVVVDAVEQHAWWWFAHVFKERLESIAPAVTDRDAPTAVFAELRVFRIGAALLHRGPTLVGGSAAPPMRASEGAKLFAVEAFATEDVPAEEGVAANDLLRPAIAQAVPHGAPVPVHVGKADNRQSSETLTSDISECGHGGFSVKLLCQEAARRFSDGPSRHSTIFCGRLQ
jgi:predicted TIM-barrel fold metal-dependent hydrolase